MIRVRSWLVLVLHCGIVPWFLLSCDESRFGWAVSKCWQRITVGLQAAGSSL